MNYSVDVDEAGGFAGSKTKSIVGGFITTATREDMRQRLEKVLHEINARQGTSFTRQDLHRAPLFHPRAFTGDQSKTGHFPKSAVNDLTDTLRRELDVLSVHCFNSKGKKFLFDSLSPQALHGLNLMAMHVIRTTSGWGSGVSFEQRGVRQS